MGNVIMKYTAASTSGLSIVLSVTFKRGKVKSAIEAPYALNSDARDETFSTRLFKADGSD